MEKTTPYLWQNSPAEREEGIDAVIEAVSQDGPDLLRRVAEHGAVLLRGFPFTDPAQVERVLDGLGLTRDPKNVYAGNVKRAATGTSSMEVTQVDRRIVVPPHTESYYWFRQPKYVVFFCQAAQCQYGETPLFHGGKVVELLPASLLERLRSSEIVCRYRFTSAENQTSIWKSQRKNSWQNIAQNDRREAFEQMLARDDVRYRWCESGEVDVEVTTKIIGYDPHSRTESFRGYDLLMWDTILTLMHSHLRHRIPATRYYSLYLLLNVYRALYSLLGPHKYFWSCRLRGAALSRKEKRLLLQAIGQSMTLFQWQAGDLLIVDNLQMGHGRMNVDGERKLHAFLADYRDQKEIYAF